MSQFGSTHEGISLLGEHLFPSPEGLCTVVPIRLYKNKWLLHTAGLWGKAAGQLPGAPTYKKL